MLQQIRFFSRGNVAEGIADFLLENGALSVELLDADAGTPAESPQFAEPNEPAELWENIEIVSLWQGFADFAKAFESASPDIFQKKCTFTVENVENENWVEKTQAQFAPIEVTRDFWIVPTWCNTPPSAKIVVALNPGMAFGTGSHPTTRLCLEWLSQNVKTGDRVLDYGTGSGILAIAAAKMGACEIIAVDIDEQALTAARQNTVQNNVQNIQFLNAEEKVDGVFDIVVANILANPLRLLAPLLCSHVKENGGALILSGLLESQADEIAQIYQQNFLSTKTARTLDGWALLAGRR